MAHDHFQPDWYNFTMSSDTAVPTTVSTFHSLALPKPLLDAVSQLGYQTPSPIQAQGIPVLLEGRDIIGIAQTGTGKTAAFGLPLLASLDLSSAHTQALVLTPTRELAIQVAEAIESMATQLPEVDVLAVYGGAPYPPQIRALKSGVKIVVGTPGRVMDHLEKGTLDLSGVHFLALDEADEMLRMGFAEDVDQIFSAAPKERQVALFSATMPAGIRKVAARHLNDPVEIAVSRQSSTVDLVEQSYAIVPFRHKIGALSRVLATRDADASIVFCRTRGAAEDVGSALIANGVSAATISGDVPQKERERIVERLRSGALDVLVATDVAARGLDVDRIGLVVNFDIPGEPEAYVHRIGRTGRAGRTGQALSFVTPAERNKLRNIERVIKVQITEVQIPTPADVSATKARKLLAGATERAAKGRLYVYEELLSQFLEETALSQRELLTVLCALAVGDQGPAPREEAEAEELAAATRAAKQRERRDSERPARESHTRPDRAERRGDKGKGSAKRSFDASQSTRYRLAVGHTHGVNPGGIVGALTGEGGITGNQVGKIDIFPTFSLVSISTELDDIQLAKLHRAHVAGRKLRISVDQGPKARPIATGAGRKPRKPRW